MLDELLIIKRMLQEKGHSGSFSIDLPSSAFIDLIKELMSHNEPFTTGGLAIHRQPSTIWIQGDITISSSEFEVEQITSMKRSISVDAGLRYTY